MVDMHGVSFYKYHNAAGIDPNAVIAKSRRYHGRVRSAEFHGPHSVARYYGVELDTTAGKPGI